MFTSILLSVRVTGRLSVRWHYSQPAENKRPQQKQEFHNTEGNCRLQARNSTTQSEEKKMTIFEENTACVCRLSFKCRKSLNTAFSILEKSRSKGIKIISVQASEAFTNCCPSNERQSCRNISSQLFKTFFFYVQYTLSHSTCPTPNLINQSHGTTSMHLEAYKEE